MLTLNADQVPVSVQQGWPRLLQVRTDPFFLVFFERIFTHLMGRESSVYSKRFQLLQRVRTALYVGYDVLLTVVEDREEALKDDFPLEGSAYDDEDEDDEWAGDDTAWNDETEVEDETDGRDESSAYLEFLNEEASGISHREQVCSNLLQAQKFQNLEDNDSDDELGEESLLETPLDKIEPYQLFRSALLSKYDLEDGSFHPAHASQNSNKNNLNFMNLSPRT